MFNQSKLNTYLEGERVRQRRLRRSLRNSLISAAVLIVLFGVGGLVYTWWVGRNTTIPEVESVSTETPVNSIFDPSVPDPNGTIGAAVHVLTSPVKPGENASITVKSNAGADCTIKVTYNKKPSRDSGLGPKVADKYGNVSWSWTVEKTAPVGTWPVQVDCANQSKSAMVIGNLVVKK